MRTTTASLPQRPNRASSSSPDTSAEKSGYPFGEPPYPYAPDLVGRPYLRPHRMAQATRDDGMIEAIRDRLNSPAKHVRINAPSFADYFDEYAYRTVGIIGAATLLVGLIATVTK